MPCVLAMDQGTTSSRAIVFDEEGHARSMAQREFAQLFPQPGWVEHDPAEIWSSQAAVAIEALQKSGLSRADVAAIGITNQRETTIIWDRVTGRPICNAIVWQDRRTAALCSHLVAHGHAGLVQERTGLVIDPYFSATKIRWMLDNVPGARERADSGQLAFGTVDSWLIWKLTGGRRHVTDPGNASRTMLFNIQTGRWDQELLELLRIPESLLPEIVPSSGVAATVSDVPELRDVPIAGIAGDQQAALFGQMCLSPGEAKCTYGTGCFVLQHTGSRPAQSRYRLLATIAWDAGRGLQYALEGSVFVGGAVVQWLRDGLGIIGTSAEIESLASTVADSGGVYLVPAFAGLGAPHWDAQARGGILGLTRGTTRAHIARAALEGIAFQVLDVLEAMASDSGERLRELRVDGGASANNLLMQFQADVLGVPLVRPAVTETTALGAAYMAGLGVGLWQGPQSLAGRQPTDRRFDPLIRRDEAAALRERWNEAVRRVREWQRDG